MKLYKNTSLQNENNELHGNNTNTSTETSYESSIFSIDAADEDSPLQSKKVSGFQLQVELSVTVLLTQL